MADHELEPAGALETITIGALDTEISVDTPRELIARVREQWAACPAAGASLRGEHTVTLTGTLAEPEALEYELTRRVTEAAIVAQRGRRLMLHAAAVVDPTSGRAAALVAESGGGKTTAAIRLCQQHFAYLTDEAVAMDEQLLAFRYHKPLSIVTDPEQPHLKAQHSPGSLGLRLAETDATVAAVILLARDTDPTTARLEDVPLLEALTRIIPQTSALAHLEHPLTRLVDLISACGGVRRLHYAEIADAVELVQASITHREPAPRPVVHRPEPGRRVGPDHPPATGESPEPVDLTGSVHRAPFTEAVEQDDELLVLVGTNSYLLRGVGSALWLAADRPVTVQELIAECVARFGDPGDAAERVRAAVDDLLEHSLLAEHSS